MKIISQLKSLYYFGVAAEQLSIKVAAEKLFVTQAAVSQQIRLLEESLGMKLFERHHRAITLTEAGEKLLPFVKVAFDSLERGLSDLATDDDPNTLSVSVLPSFASKWLIPRLSDFYKHCPGITVNLTMSDTLERFQDSSVDLAIRFGAGEYEGLQSSLLMRDYIYPVCHPDYKQSEGIKGLADIERVQLLDDVDRYIAWDNWLAAKKLTATELTNRIRFDGSHYVIDAALGRQGVAIVRHSLAAESVRQGNLVRLFGQPVKLGFAYYLCAPAYAFRRSKVKKFQQWMQRQAKEFDEGYGKF